MYRATDRVENWFITSLQTSVNDTTDQFRIGKAPNITTGRIVIDPFDEENKEIVYFGSTDGNLLKECVRGDDNTTAKYHLEGTLVAINVVAADINDLYAEWAEVQDQIASAGLSNQIISEAPAGIQDGINKVFTLAQTPSAGTLALYLNGVRQKYGATNDYTLSGYTITFVDAPLSTDVILADYWLFETGAFLEGTATLDTSRTPTGTINGTNKVFTTPNPYIGGTLDVYVNGLKQVPATHFTETTPTSGVFTMSDAPIAGDNILCNYQRSVTMMGSASYVGGYAPSTTPAPNSLLVLNDSGKYPITAVTGLSTPDSAWISVAANGNPQPSFMNGWVNYDTTYNPASFMKDANGFVHLRGLVKNGTVGATIAIFQLPVGYRPLYRWLCTVSSNGALGRCDVTPDGYVIANVGNAAWFSIDGIIFLGEQ